MNMGSEEKLKRLPLRFHRIFVVVARFICILIILILVRFLLLVRIGVGNGSMSAAMLEFPPPSEIKGTTPFPLMLKFHKVAGSTVVDSLWRNIQCPSSGLNQAWRENLCGNYDTHKNLLFVRGGLPYCTRTTNHLVITIFRQPVSKLISTLYWYPPFRLRNAAPWTTKISNWTIDDVNFMMSKLSADRNPALQPPLQEYTAVLGSGLAHSDATERKRLTGNKLGDYDGNKFARRRAVTRLHEDETLVVGLTERLDASMVLIALSLGWPIEVMQYESKKSTLNLKAGDNHFNINAGKYAEMPSNVRAYIKHVLQDDEYVYGVATDVHFKQIAQFPDFKLKVDAFKSLQSGGSRNIECVKLHTENA